MLEPPSRPPAARRAARCWTLCSADGATDVELLAADEEPLGRLLPVLAHALGVPVPGLWAGSTRLPDDLPLSSPELAHAAVLGVGRPGPRTHPAARSGALELHVVGGPEAGRTAPLGQGRHVLGRGSEASLRLDDPDVSRRHAQLSVGGGRLTVADLGSTNGSRLDGADLDGAPRPWPDGAVLRLGSSAVTVRGPGGCPAAVEPGPGGRLRVRPSARLVSPGAEVRVEFPSPPAPPPRRRLAWLAVALPAVAGGCMAWLLHIPQFLFFALLSPVVALGTWGSERWSGRREGRRSAAAHAVALLDAEARLAEALRADRRAAEAAWPDLASLTTAARRRSGRLWERRRADPDALQVRVGSGPGPSRVTRVTGDGRPAAPEPLEDLPVVVDLRAGGGLAVLGPRSRTTGVLTAILGQVAALHAPDHVQLALVTRGDRLADWEWLRWLPHLQRVDVVPGEGAAADEELLRWVSAEVAARRAVVDESPGGGPNPGRPPWLLVVVDRAVDARVVAALQAGRPVGVLALSAADSAARLPVAADAVLHLAGETGDLAVLRRTGQPDLSSVVVDRLRRSAAGALARDLAPLVPAGAAATPPRSVRLLDLPAASLHLADDGCLTGGWRRSRDSLAATLGRTAEGVARVDLCRQGPHALVAGTTGSGKSELLQTLIAGLALEHPPDRCSFLLVDYKGGAAFAEAVDLPHTVGLVTDLDGPATERALRSLAAELTRRESLLAGRGVADVSALPDEVALARLVIVVDEFATLAEEHPAFLPGLVGIAQRGRSLGVHLILATQRPAGVVSPEIRANCSLRICLRTTDEADSRDVLGTSQAAFLPVELPGRAYVRSGSAPPVQIQVARVVTAAHGGAEEPAVRRWAWPATAVAARTDRPTGASDLARLTAALRRFAGESGIPAPHRPWLAPLPAQLAAEELDRVGSPPPRTRLRLGLVDRPDAQAQEALELDLAEGGGWLAVGGPRSGRTTLLRTVLAEAVTRMSPAELHVHVLDHAGGALAAAVAALAHVGTTVGPDDPLRTVRLVDRLAEEVARRRSGGRADRDVALLLLVDGVDSLCGQLDEADPGRGSAALLRLVREGAAAGLTCVLAADRAVPGGRLAAVADHRLILPLPDRADYAVAGIAARAVPDVRPPGRALLGETAMTCQLALPRRIVAAPDARPSRTAVRIAELPPDPEVPLPAPAPGSGRLVPHLPIGPGGDEGGTLTIDLGRSGGLLVVGPPGSGRSCALQAFSTHLAHAGYAVLGLGIPPPAVRDDIRRVDPGDQAGAAEELAAWLAAVGPGPAAVVVDDVAALADAPLLTGLPASSPAGPLLVLAAGQAADVSRIYQGPVAALRRGRTGLLLVPAPGDAELLGIRLPRAPVPARPGSGWLVTGGVAQRVQVARRRIAP